MKVQSLAVIFAIIILPVIIILSYYIHREVDTIALQTAYDTKLIDATHDAMSSFELNTANEDLSSVADALRSIIEASNNTFFNSLATNLGMSNANKSYVQSYIPAILYTLYDGYYIYSPTRVPEVLVGKSENKETSEESDQLVYVGDLGINYEGNNAEGVGKYSFDKELFRNINYEPESEKSTRQNSLYAIINNKYEYGQILYKNSDGTYSPKLNSETYYKQDYILKSYMPYSARYLENPKDPKNSKYDLTINYTLDNYMSVMGYIDDIYYSKTGYLIGKGIVNRAEADGINLLEYNEIDAENICLSEKHHLEIAITPYLEDGKSRSQEIIYTYDPYNDLNYKEQKEKLNKYYEDIESYYNEYRTTEDESRKSELLVWIAATNVEIQNLESSLETLTAITYYVKAQVFSNWVYSTLGNDDGGLNIKEKNISDEILSQLNNKNYTTDLSDDIPAFHHSFENSERIIFDKDKDPEYLESPFSEHKFDAIKNSIQYNLNLALSSYDKMAGEMDIKMPVMSDLEWEKILNNVSIVSFMQGLNCGLKYYNNYAIISSTNNELTVIPNEIYYTKKSEYNYGDISSENALYHRIDCEDLDDTDDLISFRSKEVKYDKIYDKDSGRYKYDHKNFGCYNCIINRNYKKRLNPITEADETKGYSDDIIISALTANKKKAYYRAIGKARANIYKTNALTDSNGYAKLTDREYGISTYFDDVGVAHLGLYITAKESKPLKNIKALEFTISNVNAENPNVNKIPFEVRINPSILGTNYGDVINLGIIELNVQELPQTVTVPVHIEDISKTYSNTVIHSFGFHIADEVNKMPTSSIRLKDVKVVYE